MESSSRASLMAFDLLPSGSLWPGVIPRTLLLNQLIALPVALAMTAVNGEFLRNLAIVTIYSQTIGLLCMSASIVTFPRIDALPPASRVSAVVGVFFLMGAAGAEIARRVSAVIFPTLDDGSIIASAAVGVTVAVLVGVMLITVRHLRARLVSTELEALQARINPHFLFNTLNSIAALIREDPARAEAMTLQLSALFRYTLQAPRQGLVSLEDEIAIVEGYLAIEQARLADRLRYEIDIDPALLPLRIPALILQPLVENAIKHGIAGSVAGGTVSVRGWRDRSRVHLSVRNSGGSSSHTTGTGEGLDSVRRRLRATFGRDASVTLDSADGSTEAHLTFESPDVSGAATRPASV